MLGRIIAYFRAAWATPWFCNARIPDCTFRRRCTHCQSEYAEQTRDCISVTIGALVPGPKQPARPPKPIFAGWYGDLRHIQSIEDVTEHFRVTVVYGPDFVIRPQINLSTTTTESACRGNMSAKDPISTVERPAAVVDAQTTRRPALVKSRRVRSRLRLYQSEKAVEPTKPLHQMCSQLTITSQR